MNKNELIAQCPHNLRGGIQSVRGCLSRYKWQNTPITYANHLEYPMEMADDMCVGCEIGEGIREEE
jgi:hypothetical protein